jgi:TonB family protein
MSWQNLLNFSTSANWILLTAFHSLWLSIAVFLLMHLRKLRSPVVRSTWCTCTLVLLLALPLITWSIPKLAIRTQPASQPAVETSTAITETPAPLLNRLMDINTPMPEARMSRWKEWLNQFGFLWLAVTLIFAGRLLYQLAFLKGFCTNLQEIRDSRIAAILKECSHSFRFRRTPRIFSSRKLSSPISTGIQTPLVILPAPLYQSIGGNELRAIVLHELAHIYHYDHLLGLLQQIIKSLYWWNPFIYGLCNSLSVAREEVSDNYAISGMDSAAGYARLLVSLVEKTSLISRLPCTAGMGTSYELLESRIKNIVSKERDMRVKINKRMMSLILAAFVLFCVVVVIGSQVTVFGVGQTSVAGQKSNEPPAATASGEPTKVTYEYRLSKMLIDKVDPIYPERALQSAVSSKITLKINVNEEGLVSNAQIITGQPLFNDAATTAVKQWKFHPSMLSGVKNASPSKPVAPPPPDGITKLPFNMTLALDFRLTKNKSPKISISAVPGSYELPSLGLLSSAVAKPDK